MHRLFEVAFGLGLTWLASSPPAHVEGTAPAPAAPPPLSAPIGEAFDSDAAMAPHAAPVASYTLSATLDPAAHVVTGRGTITWRNASLVPVNEVWVHLYLNGFKDDRTNLLRSSPGDWGRGSGSVADHGFITVERFGLAGVDLWPGADKTSPGDPDDATDIRVPLPSPVEPDAAVVFDVEFTSRLPSILLRTGYDGGFHMVAQWFPKIARIEPSGRFAHFAFHRLSEFYADFGDYDVTIDTPEGVVVGAVGELAGEEHAGGRVKRRFVQRDVHDFAFAAWDGFRESTALTEGGVAVRSLYPPGYERAAEIELDAVRVGLQRFGEAYGRYPYATLTVVHPPAGAHEAGGMEYPTLITVGGPWYMEWTGTRFFETVTLHELAHQWFYGLVATDEHGWPFLDEGVTSYAEVDLAEQLSRGSSQLSIAGLAVGLPAWNRMNGSAAERNAVIAQPASSFVMGGDYGALVYSRTATILTTLGEVYGRDAVRRAVGRYARRYRFQHPGPNDLLQAVREVVGDDAAEQMRVALFERGTVDYAVAEVTSEPDAGSGHRGAVVVRRRGALRFPVDVDMISEDGTVRRERWDAEEPAARLSWHGESRLVGAVIDPERRVLLDDDLGNNAYSTRGQSLSLPLLDRLGFFAGAALSGVLP